MNFSWVYSSSNWHTDHSYCICLPFSMAYKIKVEKGLKMFKQKTPHASETSRTLIHTLGEELGFKDTNIVNELLNSAFHPYGIQRYKKRLQCISVTQERGDNSLLRWTKYFGFWSCMGLPECWVREQFIGKQREELHIQLKKLQARCRHSPKPRNTQGLAIFGIQWERD